MSSLSPSLSLTRQTRRILNTRKLHNFGLNRTFITIIQTSETGIKQTFGKAGSLISDKAMLQPGFHFYLPIVQNITKVTNRLRQTDVMIEVKTRDNVFAKLRVSIQWSIKRENTLLAVFSLQSPVEQIKAYVENVLRSKVTQTSLDELFSVQYEIADSIREVLSDVMSKYGYSISDTLITDIDPEKGVKDSMNEINKTERLKIAAQNKADSYYIQSVREAEADAERKRLQGQGISDQRKAIMNGYRDNIEGISRQLGIAPHDLLYFMERMQRWDTYSEFARSNNSKVIIVPEESRTTQAFLSSREAGNDERN